MIEKHVASQLIDRLSGLNWYPREGTPQIELCLALESAENEFIAGYVVDQWVKYQTDAPKPAELRRLVWEENEKLEQVRKEEREAASERKMHGACPQCHGFGVVESIPGAPIDSVCSYCTCEAGRRAISLGSLHHPEAVNAARQKLLVLREKPSKMLTAAIADDDYRGEF